jgi:hypothetical protein
MLDRIEDLRARGRKHRSGDLRASDADRTDALRRLDAHRSLGHLDQHEAVVLGAELTSAQTPNQIRQIFVGAKLPELPAQSPLATPRVSGQDRLDAIGRLERAYAEGRLDSAECAAAKDQVGSARTREEIEAAFHGLRTPSRLAESVAQTASVGSRVAVEGGRRAQKAFRRGAFATGALVIGLILLIAGIGPAALICFVAAVLLFVGAALALVSSGPQGKQPT